MTDVEKMVLSTTETTETKLRYRSTEGDDDGDYS